MTLRFNGLRALVTGGGRGLGRDIARALVRDGAKTFVLTKSASSVESLRREDPEIEAIQSDITDWDNVRRVVKSILPVDLLVNNAGTGVPTPFMECTESAIDSVFNVNVKPIYNISQVVAEDLIKRKQKGAIVNMSSVFGVMHIPLGSVYGTSKAAVDSLTRNMAKELGPKQIRVNSVNPTLIPTDLSNVLLNDPEFKAETIKQIPLGRIGEKQEVTDVVLFLLSEQASMVHGVNVRIDGGQAL